MGVERRAIAFILSHSLMDGNAPAGWIFRQKIHHLALRKVGLGKIRRQGDCGTGTGRANEVGALRKARRFTVTLRDGRTVGSPRPPLRQRNLVPTIIPGMVPVYHPVWESADEWFAKGERLRQNQVNGVR